MLQTHRHTHRHRHTDTHRHTQTHTDTHRHTQTHTDTHTHTHRYCLTSSNFPTKLNAGRRITDPGIVTTSCLPIHNSPLIGKIGSTKQIKKRRHHMEFLLTVKINVPTY